jgi:hypothetical protein
MVVVLYICASASFACPGACKPPSGWKITEEVQIGDGNRVHQTSDEPPEVLLPSVVLGLL